MRHLFSTFPAILLGTLLLVTACDDASQAQKNDSRQSKSASKEQKHEDVTYEGLKERYSGDNHVKYAIEKNLIEDFNSTSDKCPKDKHYEYSNDPARTAGVRAPRFNAWRPAYVGIDEIVLVYTEPAIYRQYKAFPNKPYDYYTPESLEPLTKSKWIKYGNKAKNYKYTQKDKVLDFVSDAVQQELIYCTVQKGNEDKAHQNLRIADDPLHTDVDKPGVLTISLKPVMILHDRADKTGSYHIHAHKYLPRWAPMMRYNLCGAEAKSKTCSLLEPISKYLTFPQGPEKLAQISGPYNEILKNDLHGYRLYVNSRQKAVKSLAKDLLR